MTDNLVRLGLALSAIMLISACLYQFGGRQAVAIEPAIQVQSQR
jgi:hypothetical protein